MIGCDFFFHVTYIPFSFGIGSGMDGVVAAFWVFFLVLFVFPMRTSCNE